MAVRPMVTAHRQVAGDTVAANPGAVLTTATGWVLPSLQPARRAVIGDP